MIKRILTLVILTSMLSFKPPYQHAEAIPVPIRKPVIVPAVKRLDEQQLYCMTRAIYHEARGEPFIGQTAVAHVVLNRAAANDRRWPKTVCEVIYQPDQFTDIQKFKPTPAVLASSEWQNARRIAIVAMLGLDEDPTKGALFYYSHTKITAPWWARTKSILARFNNHTFLGDQNEHHHSAYD